ncbi:uncharacterized protein F4807DRAFT_393322 [Annulohypoxylon truncatum]|uniref:uncharacterized protein n=1 Tax=Annulohypoxylon truncatum TaxID=327061 RepID=UPI0020083A73|nr:uncharacterized protein F4807DRAFT_393322 [Annulohypoxylon truncatum]KAI1211542.1 hypothetical protein F4807DRAFT_393322 [Annulohypoxylon truncatum]
MFAQDRMLTLSEAEFLARLEPAFLNAHDNNMSNNNGGGDNWIGQAEDPLSASNILTCLDPGAIAAKEHDKEVDADGAGPFNPSKRVEPRWYSDARMSLIMRALEDARRDLRTRSPPGVAAVAQEGDDNTGKSSVERIRRKFDAATAAGTPERSKTADFVAGAITTAVAEMLFVDVSDVNPARTVADHGVDSFIAAELLNWFSDALRTKINMRELLDAKTSIATMAGWIADTALAKKQNSREEQ